MIENKQLREDITVAFICGLRGARSRACYREGLDSSFQWCFLDAHFNPISAKKPPIADVITLSMYGALTE